jgi:tetratricopeptide (TPR) repeat protein
VAEKDPGNPAALFEYGETLRRLGRVDEAGRALDGAIAAGPSMSEAWIAKGHVLVTQSKPEEAARCYEKALALSPDAVGALNPLAAHYLDLNKPEKAFPLLARAEAEGIADADTFLILGRIHLIQNKLQEAQKDFATSLQLSDDPRRTLKAQADIFVIRNHVGQGVRLYEEGMRLYPEYAPNYLTLATIALQAEQPGRALALFKKALSLDLDPDTRKNVQEIVAELEAGPK